MTQYMHLWRFAYTKYDNYESRRDHAFAVDDGSRLAYHIFLDRHPELGTQHHYYPTGDAWVIEEEITFEWCR